MESENISTGSTNPVSRLPSRQPSHYCRTQFNAIVIPCREHIAPVLSLTPALDFSVVVSGGDDSSIIVASMRSGRVRAKIDHHRGPVTALCVDSAGDVLVSGKPPRALLWRNVNSLPASRILRLVSGFSYNRNERVTRRNPSNIIYFICYSINDHL